MAWIAEHGLALLLLGLYTALLVLHGLEGKRRTRGRVDYYVGGRSMGGVAIGLSFFATYSSTNSFVGFSGQAYSYGAPWLLLAPCVVAFSLAAWVWVAPRLRRFTEAVDSLTLADYIGFRFDSTAARVLAALVILFASFLYMTAVFKGIGNLLQVFLHIPYTVAILVVFVAVMLYTAVGGFISVVKTDAVQGVVMVVAGLLLFGGTVRAAGGAGSVLELARIPETADLFSWDAAMPFPVLIGIIVAGSLKFVVEPRQLSRFYALADDRAVRRGVWVSTLSFLVVYTLLVPIGLYAHRVIGGGIGDTDLVVPTLLSGAVVEGGAPIFPPLVGAFLLVAMVAAAMSSLDSVLLVMASTAERDLASVLRPGKSETAALRDTRAYVALFALVTALLAVDPPGTIVTLTAFSGSLYAACFLPAVILGLWWRRGDGVAATGSLVLGLLTLLAWPLLPVGDAVHEVFPAMLLSTGAYVVAARARPPATLPEGADALWRGK